MGMDPLTLGRFGALSLASYHLSEDKITFPENSFSYGLWLATREMCRSPEKQMQDGIGGHRALRVCGAHLVTHDWLTLDCRNTAAARLLSLPGLVGSSSLSSSWTELGYPAKRAGTFCGQLPLSELEVVRHGSQLLLDCLHFTLSISPPLRRNPNSDPLRRSSGSPQRQGAEVPAFLGPSQGYVRSKH